jgi:hypothetical protein
MSDSEEKIIRNKVELLEAQRDAGTRLGGLQSDGLLPRQFLSESAAAILGHITPRKRDAAEGN